MKIFRRYWIFAVTLVILSSFSMQVFAESLEDKLNDLQTQMSDEKSKADQAQVKVDNVSEQLRAVQENLRAATDEYDAVKKQLSDTEDKITYPNLSEQFRLPYP